MRISGGNRLTKHLECVDSARNIWKLRWDFSEGSFEEVTLSYKPSLDEIKNIIYNHIDKETQDTIVNKFIWNNTKIYLDQHNQLNYKVAYDLAVQSAGVSLPVKFKFGSVDNPIYHKFTTLSELTDFYTSMVKHIQNTLQVGWEKKDNINWADYE